MTKSMQSALRLLALTAALASGAFAAPVIALAAGQRDCYAEQKACYVALDRCNAQPPGQSCPDTCVAQLRQCEAARRAARMADPAVQAARVCPDGWALDAQFTSRRNPEAFKCLGTPGTQPATDYQCPMRLHLHRHPKEGSFICGGVL